MKKILILALCAILLTGCGAKQEESASNSGWKKEKSIDDSVNAIGVSANYSEAGRAWYCMSNYFDSYYTYAVTQGDTKYFVNASNDLIRMESDGDTSVLHLGRRPVQSLNVTGNKVYTMQYANADDFVLDLTEYDMKAAIEDVNYTPKTIESYAVGSCVVKDGYLYYQAKQRGLYFFIRRNIADGKTVEVQGVDEEKLAGTYGAMVVGVNEVDEMIYMYPTGHYRDFIYGTVNFDTNTVTENKLPIEDGTTNDYRAPYPIYSEGKLYIILPFKKSMPGRGVEIYVVDGEEVSSYNINIEYDSLRDIGRYERDFILLTEEGFYRVSVEELQKGDSAEAEFLFADKSARTFAIVGNTIYYANNQMENFSVDINGEHWLKLDKQFSLDN